jgi:hypothetical protein
MLNRSAFVSHVELKYENELFVLGVRWKYLADRFGLFCIASSLEWYVEVG